MQRFTITLPENVPVDEKKLTVWIACKLYESAALSLGQAAEWIGMTKPEFVDALVQNGVSMFNYPPSDLRNEFRG